MNWEIFIIIAECMIILCMGFHLFRVARQGMRLKKKFETLKPDERERVMIEARKQNSLSLMFFIEPLDPSIAFLAKVLTAAIIVIFGAFLIFCIFIVARY